MTQQPPPESAPQPQWASQPEWAPEPHKPQHTAPVEYDQTLAQPTGNDQTPAQPAGSDQPPAQLQGSDPTPAQPTGNDQTPAQPEGSDQAPAQPEGSDPTLAQPTGNDPTPTQPIGYDPTPTQPIGYDQAQAPSPWMPQPQGPAYAPPVAPNPTEPFLAAFSQPSPPPKRSARPRRLVELGAIAVLAAILSSAGTYAVTRTDDVAPAFARTGTTATTSSAPVVQADPSAPNWAVTASAVSPSVVAITVTTGDGGDQGSGVIYDTSGHILTNNHVVAAAGQGSSISVTLNDLRTYDATVVGTDPSTDLAIIKLTNPPNDLKPIALGNANAITVGEPVMAVGNPLGLAGTVTTGIVSALNRPVTTSDQQPGDQGGGQGNQFGAPAADPVVTNAIQTSAAINPGNSGGALVNAGGQLIGINSSIASLGSSGGSSTQSGNIGIGFAIPVDQAGSIADQLISSGKATHAYMGVSSKDDVVTVGSAKRSAAVLTSVASGTPAAKAGLKTGDAIISVDGKSVDGSLSLVAQVRERTAGDKVTIRIVRDGQTKDVAVTLTNRPATVQ
jgi:putative serine protease PepD